MLFNYLDVDTNGAKIRPQIPAAAAERADLVKAEMAGHTKAALDHLNAIGLGQNFTMNSAKIVSACAKTHDFANRGVLEGGICVAPEQTAPATSKSNVR